MKKIIKNKKATSLIEITIGIVLLALILIPSLNVIIGQTKTVNSTRDHAQAAFLADKILETAKAWDFKMLDKETFNRFYKDDSTKTEKQTLEYQLTDSADNNYNKYEMNGITYTIDKDANYTKIEPIYTKDTDKNEALPLLYSFKYSIIYESSDGKDCRLNIHTVLAKR